VTNQIQRNYLEIKSISELIEVKKPLESLHLEKGYFEQNIHIQKHECEIAYFGILEEYIGKKIGAYLLSEAIKKSFKTGSKRIWVHTCSLDHKHALENYLSRGMKVFKSENLSL